MRNGGYYLNVSCDSPVHDGAIVTFHSHTQAGETERACLRELRAIGWHFGNEGQPDLCPSCWQAELQKRLRARAKAREAEKPYSPFDRVPFDRVSAADAEYLRGQPVAAVAEAESPPKDPWADTKVCADCGAANPTHVRMSAHGVELVCDDCS